MGINTLVLEMDMFSQYSWWILNPLMRFTECTSVVAKRNDDSCGCKEV